MVSLNEKAKEISFSLPMQDMGGEMARYGGHPGSKMIGDHVIAQALIHGEKGLHGMIGL